MWRHYSRPALLTAVLALAPACQDPGYFPQLQLVTSTCEGLGPLEGVTHFRLRVTGEGLDTPIERITPVIIRPEDVPVIPPGPRRLFEVRAYSGEPSSAGSVISVGRSFPFDMPDTGAPTEPIRVTLRRVNTFIPVESSQVPGSCLDLTEPRAGHTATLLEDGRVVIAGGFRVSDEGQTETVSSIEILDPQARTLTFVGDPGPGAARRAFHTASRMLDGRVALIGGESQPLDGPTTTLRTGAVFDPLTQRTQQFDLTAARSHHAAAIDLAGRILVVGGLGADGAVVSTAEGVEPAAGRSFAVPTPVPRVGASVVTLADNQRIAVIGGSDGVNLPREVLTFSFTGSTFALTNTTVMLRQARRDAAVAAFDDGQKLLVMGGYASPGTPDDSARPVAASELLGLKEGSPFVAVGPSVVARGDLCAASLPGGRVFTAGGRRSASEAGFASSGVVELITPTENVTGGVLGMKALEPSRYLHTCTPLPDGSVLIAGGLDASGGRSRMVAGTYIFMPVPRD
jgi:hypothetical protein